LELLGDDRPRVKGIIFNKFRGDLSLFNPAVKWTEDTTGVKVVGVMPWTQNVRVPGEDSLSIRWNKDANAAERHLKLVIGVIKLPYISNYTDMEAFAAEPDVALTEVDEHTSLDGVDAVILPGTKSTVQDMKSLHASGLAKRLMEFHEKGGFLFGLCGGYQMLGEQIDDRHLRDNDELREMEGLGLLPVVTAFETTEKTTLQANGYIIHPSACSEKSKVEVKGYEIHFGETTLLRKDPQFQPLFLLNGQEDGLADLELRVAGTYMHNAFHNDEFRACWLNALRRRKGYPELPVTDTASQQEKSYDLLAAKMKEHLDMRYIFELAGLEMRG
jgi:adenosylcobyric acid synthase